MTGKKDSNCISWAVPLNKVIHSSICSILCDKILQIIFSSSDRFISRCTVPHQIKSLILHDTSAFSWWVFFFSPASQRDTLFHGQERCSKTFHQRQAWTKHDLSIWQWSPQQPHALIKQHHWELCHPAKRPAELSALVEYTDYWKWSWEPSFVSYQSILRATKSNKAYFSVKQPAIVQDWKKQWGAHTTLQFCKCGKVWIFVSADLKWEIQKCRTVTEKALWTNH